MRSVVRMLPRAGQVLTAGDLEILGSYAAELLALHQARLHGVWGIVTGFECSLRDGLVQVAPGLALDAAGRFLVHPAITTHAVPEIPEGQTRLLVAALRPPDADCGTRGAGQALPRWIAPGHEPSAGYDLSLMRLRRVADRAEPTLDLGVRRVAHGLVRPKIATGRVPSASLPVTGSWSSWSMNVPTGLGGLTSVKPAYFVTLDQHPFGPAAGLGDPAVPPAADRLANWVGPFVSIESCETQSFTLRVSAFQPGWFPREGPALNPVGFTWTGVDTSAQPFNFLGFLRVLLLDPRLFSGGFL